MQNSKFPLPACALIAMLVGLTGCSQKSPDIRLTSLSNKAIFTQQFDDAYIGKSAEGNTEVVLAGGNPDGIRQVMHVKILWRPQRGTKQGHPSYTNAGLHWYVFDESKNGSADMLEYTGAGFVSLSDSPVGTEVKIRNATVKPVARASASLNDPIGPAHLTGSFFAKKSKARVQELLAEVANVTQNESAQQASAR
jgi:hypothetical protein